MMIQASGYPTNMGLIYVCGVSRGKLTNPLTLNLDLFGPDGKMLTAIQPNDAIVPIRNDSISFSADSPPRYVDNGESDDVNPADPDSGRDNNHGELSCRIYAWV